MDTEKWYKLIDIKDNSPYTLFHGVNGSRELPVDEWIQADKKMVMDGSSGTEYLSGFHVLKSEEEALEYLEYFKNVENKGIAICECKNIRDKEHSRSNVFLADDIRILNFYELDLEK